MSDLSSVVWMFVPVAMTVNKVPIYPKKVPDRGPNEACHFAKCKECDGFLLPSEQTEEACKKQQEGYFESVTAAKTGNTEEQELPGTDYPMTEKIGDEEVFVTEVPKSAVRVPRSSDPSSRIILLDILGVRMFASVGELTGSTVFPSQVKNVQKVKSLTKVRTARRRRKCKNREDLGGIGVLPNGVVPRVAEVNEAEGVSHSETDSLVPCEMGTQQKHSLLMETDEGMPKLEVQTEESELILEDSTHLPTLHRWGQHAEDLTLETVESSCLTKGTEDCSPSKRCRGPGQAGSGTDLKEPGSTSVLGVQQCHPAAMEQQTESKPDSQHQDSADEGLKQPGLTDGNCRAEGRPRLCGECDEPDQTDSGSCPKETGSFSVLGMQRRRHAAIEHRTENKPVGSLQNSAVEKLQQPGLTDGNCHAQTRPRLCGDCGGEFATPKLLAQHFHYGCPGKKVTCRRCDTEFPTPKLLAQHFHYGCPGKKVVCNRCDTEFPTPKWLAWHVRLECPSQKVTCNDCGAEFDKPKLLARHIRLGCPKKKVTCNDCGTVFDTPKLLARHRLRGCSKKKVTCNDCDTVFETPKLLTRHRLLGCYGKKVTCNDCNAVFDTPKLLARHRFLECPSQEATCTDCGTEFATAKLLAWHLRLGCHSNQRQCEKCGTEFDTPELLAWHLHLGCRGKKVTCNECDTEFYTLKLLARHLRLGCLGKKVNCNDCGAKFDTPKLLERHLDRGCPSKKLQCDECKAQFATWKLLARHLHRMCTGKKLQCTECGFTCMPVNLACLKHHMLRHGHLRLHKCMACNINFITAGELLQHVRCKHNGEELHRCTQCSYASTDASELKTHVRMHIGKYPFQCLQCPYVARNSCILERHVRMHTGEVPFECDSSHESFDDANVVTPEEMALSSREPVFSNRSCSRSPDNTTKPSFGKVPAGEKSPEDKAGSGVDSQRISFDETQLSS